MKPVQGHAPKAEYTIAAAATLVGLSEGEVATWLRSRGIKTDRPRANDLDRLWRDAPPRVRFSRAPIGTRAELLAYAGDNVTRREEVQRLVTLLRVHELDTLDRLWDLAEEAVKRWARRDRQVWRDGPERDERQEVRIIRPLVLAIASARRREPPAWLESLLPRDETLARTDFSRWVDHSWRTDIEASLSTLTGTAAGVESRRSCLLELAYHLARNAPEPLSLGAALVAPKIVVAAFREIETGSRAAHGSWSTSSEKHLLEVVRPILLAGAADGTLSDESTRALAERLRCQMPYHASQVPELVRSYRVWARHELRRAGLKPDAKKPVRPPEDDEVAKYLGELAQKIARAVDEHKARGLSLDDFRSWRSWAQDLRQLLGAGLAAHELVGGGLRGGSLHAQQPAFMAADETYGGAIRIENIIVKRVAHEGPDGITTSHGNRPYDVTLAPDIECSTWVVLPLAGFPYALRELLEWYLHSCGQCLGAANHCRSSREPVLRWIELAEEHGRWLYREAAQEHVPARTTLVSKDGEWLASLRAPKGHRVRFNPLWWHRDGKSIVLQDGLADRLADFFGNHIHRWRHYAVLYLSTAYPLSVDEAGQLIHMDSVTAHKIYNNPSSKQILRRMSERMEKLAPDERERELALAREKTAFLSGRVKELEHQLSYVKTVYGELPVPPAPPPAVLQPITVAVPQPRRRRASPRGGDAFAA